MALELQPQVVVAMHGSTDQNKEFEAKIKENQPKINVIIADPYTVVKVTLKKNEH